jgi:hypothetical protein
MWPDFSFCKPLKLLTASVAPLHSPRRAAPHFDDDGLDPSRWVGLAHEMHLPPMSSTALITLQHMRVWTGVRPKSGKAYW